MQASSCHEGSFKTEVACMQCCGSILSATAPDFGHDNTWVSQESRSLSAGWGMHTGLLPEKTALKCFADTVRHWPLQKFVVVLKQFVNQSISELTQQLMRHCWCSTIFHPYLHLNTQNLACEN